MIVSEKISVSKKNLLLIAGNGRNVGKTYLACSIISHLSKSHGVIGIKISSHFHPVSADSRIIAKAENYLVTEEMSITHKDSSLMLQSGAKKVFFIMAGEKGLKEGFEIIRNDISNHPVVCESGGLHQYITPGLFLFVSKTKIEREKRKYLIHNPVMVYNESNHLNFDVNSVSFDKNRIFIK